MNYVFHPEAKQEFFDAIDYYQSQQAGLGEDFYAEIMDTVARIARGPVVWPVLEGDIRRCLVHRFPYGILYSIEDNAIYIVAVMPLRREPGYWKDRTG